MHHAARKPLRNGREMYFHPSCRRVRCNDGQWTGGAPPPPFPAIRAMQGSIRTWTSINAISCTHVGTNGSVKIIRLVVDFSTYYLRTRAAGLWSG